MPIPGGEFEADMLRRLELAGYSAEQTNDQKDRTDDHMGSVEPGRHEERGAVDIPGIVEGRMRIFPGLHAGKGQPQGDCEHQAPDQSLAVVMEKRVMRPRDGRARSQQNESVEERQMPGVESVDAFGRRQANASRMLCLFAAIFRQPRIH